MKLLTKYFDTIILTNNCMKDNFLLKILLGGLWVCLSSSFYCPNNDVIDDMFDGDDLIDGMVDGCTKCADEWKKNGDDGGS